MLFKFAYAPETAYIFADRGGRWAACGAVLALGLIAGAIFTHLTALGIEVKDPATGEGDGGLLFGLALAVAAGSLVVLGYRWRQLPYLDRWFRPADPASSPDRPAVTGPAPQLSN